MASAFSKRDDPGVLLHLVHVSDVHYGDKHICRPEAPGGSPAGTRSLHEFIRKDLGEVLGEATPYFVCATGDLTETAHHSELREAAAFLSALLPTHEGRPALERLFVVPGNHDAVYTEQAIEPRFAPYLTYVYDALFPEPAVLGRKRVRAIDAHDLTQVIVRDAERLVVAEINSCVHVYKESPYATRGEVDELTLKRLSDQLKSSLVDNREDYARVALVHHHPILLPSLVEPRHGYDAIHGSRHLLSLLQEFGFHLVLHGHKHYPQTFSYDPDYAWLPSEVPTPTPLLVVAGGSAGSTALPEGTRRSNTYNIVTLKWLPGSRTLRLNVETRGLVRHSGAAPLPQFQWRWETFRHVDRILAPAALTPNPRTSELLPVPTEAEDAPRVEVYKALRGNMAVAEVRPALTADQGYEVVVWLVGHWSALAPPREVPVSVVWNAGPNFPSRHSLSSDRADDEFAAVFAYWCPVLIGATLTFNDGTTAFTSVYAHLPAVRSP